jgi:hypothetical protein
MEFRLAPEVAEVARPLIEEFHPHLLGVGVEFVFLGKTPKSKGKEVWGRAKKVSGLPAFLFGVASNGGGEDYEDQPPDLFVMEISEEVWRQLTPKRKRALVDHELHHMQIAVNEETGEVGLAIVEHDVTEFEGVLRRHGLWNESLEDFGEAAAEQLKLGVG